MGPNDIVVHCANAQSVTLAALGAEAWWVAFSSFFLTVAVTAWLFGRWDAKDRKAWHERARSSESAYNTERNKYEAERNGYVQDRAKQKAEHETKLLELIEQGNAYSKRSYELAVREKELGIVRAG